LLARATENAVRRMTVAALSGRESALSEPDSPPDSANVSLTAESR
jgi:hypothetical protein